MAYLFFQPAPFPPLSCCKAAQTLPAEAEVGGQEGWGEGVQAFFIALSMPALNAY